MTDPYFGNAHPPHGHSGYGQPGYGQPGSPPPPGPQGYVSYGQGTAPPCIHVPPPNVGFNELRKFEEESQLWLIVAAAGFWFGFGWLTGPLVWYKGAQLRRQYQVRGHHPCSSANWARGLGIASTLIYYVSFCVLVVMIMAAIGVLAFGV